MAEFRFQIHLGGIIDLLSNHLYSSPNVYVRELLQNATDAIRARAAQGDAPEGHVRISVHGGDRPQLTVEDNGIGLTDAEVHQFLSTIGASSKREDLDRSDYIGQFGIGLLSCFVVSDEIAVVTRSAKGGPGIRWRGKADGTYEMDEVAEDSVPVGTTVHLVAKPEMQEWFAVEKVEELAAHFGALLPFPIEVIEGVSTRRVNERPPWRRTFESASEAREASLEFGQRVLGTSVPFFDVIPLQSEGVEGLAFVLPYSPPPTAPAQQRVYLKDMLLGERVDNLLPKWAFFVTCVMNVTRLRPTASRESFYEDDALQHTRKALGDALRNYLVDLQKNDPLRLEALIALHFRAIKAVAVHDAELFDLFIDLLPFETSMGRMNFGEIRARYDRVHYAPTVDVFRQIAQVASAQRILVVNAGYSYDRDLLRRVQDRFENLHVQEVDATDLASALADVDGEIDRFGSLLQVAARTLHGFECEVDLKRFAPDDLPVLYVTGQDATFARAIDVSRRAQDEGSVWGSMLDTLAEDTSARAVLVFNANNPLVGRLARVADDRALQLTVQMLYVQALLLGHHALRPEEMSLLNVGLLDLIEWGLNRDSGPTLQ
ncbi:MAG: HSP90 family protein [Myxococcota bacterium]